MIIDKTQPPADLAAGMRPWFVSWIKQHLSATLPFWSPWWNERDLYPPPFHLTPEEERFYRTFVSDIELPGVGVIYLNHPADDPSTPLGKPPPSPTPHPEAPPGER